MSPSMQIKLHFELFLGWILKRNYYFFTNFLYTNSSLVLSTK